MGERKFCTSPSFTFVSQSRPLVISLIDIDNTIFNQDPQVVQFPIVGCNMSWERQVCTGNDNNNNNILYSSQWEIKAVVRSYTLMYNKHLYCTYLNNSKSWNGHMYSLLDIHPLSLNLHTLKHWSNANAYIKTLTLNKIIMYTAPPCSLGKLSSSAEVLTYAHTRLMTVIIFIKNWKSWG